MNDLSIAPLSAIQTVTTTDQVFESLYHALITFKLPPGTKVSEIEIAKALGVSRQPVRDAFFRLSQVGFLLIRPQRATLITKISSQAVLQASFIRTALETACFLDAVNTMTEDDFDEIRSLLAQQKTAIAADERSKFHELDDRMHQRICEMSGHGYAWALIQEQKAHMDRVRFLSLSFGQQTAFDQHLSITDALFARDADAVQKHLEEHLGRIKYILPQIREEHPQYFEDSDT